MHEIVFSNESERKKLKKYQPVHIHMYAIILQAAKDIKMKEFENKQKEI